DLADSMNAVLARNRLPPHPVEAYRYFVGDGITLLVRRALPFEVADEEALVRLVGEMQREYRERRTRKTRPYPGVIEMAAALVRAGLRLAVLSNKPEEAARDLVQELLPGVPFETVLGSVPERPRKPDPAAASEIAAGFGLDPSECIYVGDSEVDMRTATAAGMFPVGVRWGFRPEAELTAAGARLLLSEPAELLAWISGGAGDS
ncbi:MAG: HAD family hydrolase, partial [Desulfobacterales bacterium]|nr:HAD family hydrolase [Desulfobacterales bacterium]